MQILKSFISKIAAKPAQRPNRGQSENTHFASRSFLDNKQTLKALHQYGAVSGLLKKVGGGDDFEPWKKQYKKELDKNDKALRESLPSERPAAQQTEHEIHAETGFASEDYYGTGHHDLDKGAHVDGDGNDLDFMNDYRAEWAQTERQEAADEAGMPFPVKEDGAVIEPPSPKKPSWSDLGINFDGDLKVPEAAPVSSVSDSEALSPDQLVYLKNPYGDRVAVNAKWVAVDGDGKARFIKSRIPDEERFGLMFTHGFDIHGEVRYSQV